MGRVIAGPHYIQRPTDVSLKWHHLFLLPIGISEQLTVLVQSINTQWLLMYVSMTWTIDEIRRKRH